MKLARALMVLVIALVVVGLVVRSLPGCRHKLNAGVDKYGGWTEEARKADPVGFITHAEKKLTDHVRQLQDIRRNLAEGLTKISDETTRIQSLQDAAVDLAGQFKTAYTTAQANVAWPVEVAGGTYSRDQLLEQVRLVMLQGRNYDLILADLAKAQSLAKNREQRLIVQLNNTQAALSTLASKKEIARINQLTGTAETLLGQIDELIGENERVLMESPIRTVEELTSVQVKTDSDELVSKADVLAFLEDAE